MLAFCDISIRHKFTLLLLGVVSVVVFAVCAANVVTEVRTTRASMAAKYASLAQIVARQSGAALSIADVDPSGAQQIVDDLAVERAMLYAALDDLSGQEVARYVAAGASSQRPANARIEFGVGFAPDGMLEAVESVVTNDGRPVGRLHLRASTAALDRQIQRILVVASVVYAAALGLAVLLSLALQRFITQPILELAGLMNRVSAEHDYTLVAPTRGRDELGALSSGFNAMLDQIRRRDEELAHTNEHLLRTNDELRQFAYVASHDLQEPLLSVTSFCNVLREDCEGRLPSEAEDTIERIVAAASRMRLLVTGLLGYSRLSRDEQTPFAPVAVDEAMNDVAANLHGSIQQSGAELHWGRLPEVFGDRMQLVQLLQNLVGNAILYRGDDPPVVTVQAAQRRGEWEFSVRDNGIGVAPEHRDRIFEIFKRLHGRHKYPGTGIGLAVCKKIVERHGGRIWVEPATGGGSVFKFTIHKPDDEENHNGSLRQLQAAL